MTIAETVKSAESLSLNKPESSNKPQLGFLLFLILGAIAALTPLAIDMYIPAMPTIASDLKVSSSSVQITLTVYIAGFSLGQLLHGPLADSFGRRPILLTGIAFFAIAALGGAISKDMNTLIYLRTAQGFAGAAAAVVIQAIVRDMFDREDFSRAMSFVTLVMTAAPLMAPMLGGYLAVWFGWRSIFWALASFALVVITMVLWKIPETLAVEKRQPFDLKNTFRNYTKIILNPVALGLIFTGAFSFGGMFAFLTAGSFVYIKMYHVAIEHFGYLFGLNIVVMVLMTMLNSKIVKRVGLHSMLRLGLTIEVIASVGLLIAGTFDLGLWGIVPCVMLFIGTTSVIGSNAVGLLLSQYATIAGTASSLTGTLRFGTGALIGFLITQLPENSWSMLAAMAGCGFMSALSYWMFGKKAV